MGLPSTGLNTPIFILGHGAPTSRIEQLFFHVFSHSVHPMCLEYFGIPNRGLMAPPRDNFRLYHGGSSRIGSGPTAKVRDKKNMPCAFWNVMPSTVFDTVAICRLKPSAWPTA